MATAHYRRGLMNQLSGSLRRAIADLEAVRRLEPTHFEGRQLLATCYLDLGLFTAACAELDSLLAAAPHHPASHTRALAHLLRLHLDRPVRDAALGSYIPADLQHAISKGLPAAAAALSAAGPPHADGASYPPDVAHSGALGDPALGILRASVPVGRRLQVRCVGFVPNERQQRQGGLAAVELSQWLQAHWAAARDAPSSGGAGGTNGGALGWRGLYDVAVAWRHLSELHDGVFWIDGMPAGEFEAGFGSATPVLKGQHEVARYYPHYPRLFQLLRRLGAEQWTVLDAATRGAVATADDAVEVRALRGCDDFVVVPCASAVGGDTLEGTRITLEAAPPDGVELGIRTPLTPARWRAFEAKMALAWEGLTAA
eukprot:490742-Prymnesium_polylepis.1